MRKLIALVFAIIAIAVGGCGTVEGRIERNNEFAVAKVDGACDALKAYPERYEQCRKGDNAFLDCYQEKVTNRVMPSEALAICRVAVDSRGKVEPGLSANPRAGDERFGVNRPYDGYYNRTYGGYNGYGSGYSGYNWPTNQNVVNRIGPMFTMEGPAPVNHQTAPQASLRSAQCAMSREGTIAVYGAGACP